MRHADKMKWAKYVYLQFGSVFSMLELQTDKRLDTKRLNRVLEMTAM